MLTSDLDAESPHSYFVLELLQFKLAQPMRFP